MNTSLIRGAILCAAAVAVPAYSAIPKPASKAEQEAWKEHGRTLPQPEVLQPRLDPALPHYEPRTDVKLSGHFRGAASDVLADLSKRWAAAFQKYYPDVTIDLPPPYAGSLGALELIKGDLDFVMVSRELKPTDVTSFQAKFGYPPLSTPVVGGTYRHFGFLDSVVFVVNQANPLSHLSLAQLDALLSTTHLRGGEPVRTWGQLGLTGEWADKPIHVWAIKPWNGFEEFVRERVLCTPDRRGEWRPDLNFVETVFPVSPRVAEDRYAIGYTGRAYVGEGVKMLALSSAPGEPAVAPTYENVALATYPLSRVCYINLNKRPGEPLPPALAEFVRFILSSEGQQVVLDQAIYLPLREFQAASSRAALQ